jgi:hypothetical protein
VQQRDAAGGDGPIAIEPFGTSSERVAEGASRQAMLGLPAPVAAAPRGGPALLQRAPATPIGANDRIAPSEALTRARGLLKGRAAGGRENVRDFKRVREEMVLTSFASDLLGSLTHNVEPPTVGDYDRVDALVEQATEAGARQQWPTCGRLLTEAAFELRRLERRMAEAREGADAGADRAVDLLHTIQALCALLPAGRIGALAGVAFAGEAAATASVFSTTGVVVASTEAGVMAGYGLLNETAGEVTEIGLGTRTAISPAAIAQRGVLEFVGTFFGHFITGALTKALGDWLNRYVSRELIASGLPARAVYEGERFAVEVVSGVLATPFTTALTTVAARLVGNAPWPTPAQFVDQVMHEIPKGILMSVILQGVPRPAQPRAASGGAGGEPVLSIRSQLPAGRLGNDNAQPVERAVESPPWLRGGKPANSDTEPGPHPNEQVLAATGTDDDVVVGDGRPTFPVIQGGKSNPDGPRAMAGESKAPSAPQELQRLIADQARDMQNERRGESGLKPKDDPVLHDTLRRDVDDDPLTRDDEPVPAPEHDPNARRFVWDPVAIEKGNDFNRLQQDAYPVTELQLENGKFLDGSVPDREIVSRKSTSLAELSPESLQIHVEELLTKYEAGTLIADTPRNRLLYPHLVNRPLRGRPVLEVTVQQPPPEGTPLIPPELADWSRRLGVEIRDHNGVVLNAE